MVDHVNSDNLPPNPPPPPAVDGVVRSPRPTAGASVPDRIPLHPNHRPYEAYDQPALDELLLSLSEQVAAMAEAALACIDVADRAATKNTYGPLCAVSNDRARRSAIATGSLRIVWSSSTCSDHGGVLGVFTPHSARRSWSVWSAGYMSGLSA